MTETPASKGPFAKREGRGSYKRAYNKRGRVRGIVVRPEEMLDMLRDTGENAPVPPDAQFFAVGIDDANNLVQFYFYSIVAPSVNCVQLKPQSLLNLIKPLAQGIIPMDAELTGICVHDSFTYLRLDVASDHFPTLNISQKGIPLLQIRYQGNELLVGQPSDSGTRYEKTSLV